MGWKSIKRNTFMEMSCPSVCPSVGRIREERVEIIEIGLWNHTYDPRGRILSTFGVNRTTLLEVREGYGHTFFGRITGFTPFLHFVSTVYYCTRPGRGTTCRLVFFSTLQITDDWNQENGTWPRVLLITMGINFTPYSPLVNNEF